MSEAHRRKKNPEGVRTMLIESAKSLATRQGLATLTMDAVAAEAGFTKGAVFHHFSCKQDLIDAVFADLLAAFEAELEARLAADPEPYGRFTRAWLAQSSEASDAKWAPLWMASLTDARLGGIWGNWFAGQVERHGEDDPRLEAVRFAADGLWLGNVFGVMPRDPESTNQILINMTRPA